MSRRIVQIEKIWLAAIALEEIILHTSQVIFPESKFVSNWYACISSIQMNRIWKVSERHLEAINAFQMPFRYGSDVFQIWSGSPDLLKQNSIYK